MWEEFWEPICIRVIMILIAAAITTLFYNNTIAWNFNLPTLRFWEIALGIVSGRCLKCAIYNSVKKSK